uniref:Venom cub domain protein 1 n=1 Tax=Havinthus rufovarius TaxID=2764183 RepID=A0A7G7Y622_9HEMI|nr:venom cub domain protein 1 [Havinthus rufovarius]
MKLLLAVVLLATLALAEKRKVRTSAFLGSMPINDFLRQWHPNGFPAENDFIYSLATEEGRKVELTCASINIEEPCTENVFKLIDGDHSEILCGQKKDFVYKSKTNILSLQLLSGANIIKVTPECSAKPVD